MKTIETIRSLERSERIALRNSYKANVAALVTIKKSLDNPADTVEAFVEAIGYRPALLTIASMVNCRHYDGRLSNAATGWASSVEDALDMDAAQEIGCYTDSIHMAHLDQIARAMMQYDPFDHLPEPADDATQEAAEQLATFTPDSLTISGETFPAGYSRSYRSDLVHVLVEMDGQRYRIDIPADHPAHAAALAALAGETAQADEAAVVELCGAVKPVEAEPIRRKYLTIRRPPMPGSIPAGALEVGELERPQYVKGVGTVHGWVIYDRELTEDEQLDFELIAEEDAQLKPAAPKQERPERTPEEQAAKAAHGPVPEKLWIGSSFQGKGWKIIFDGELNRTRVIFARKPSAAALEAVKAAGFYWAPSMKSWNKGLTWKAFRASEALHLELQRICG